MKIVNTILLISLLLMNVSVMSPSFSLPSQASYTKPIENTQLSRTTEYKKVIVLDSVPRTKSEKKTTIIHDSTVLVNSEPLLAFVGEYSMLPKNSDIRNLVRHKQHCMYTKDINSVLEHMTTPTVIEHASADYNCYTTAIRND